MKLSQVEFFASSLLILPISLSGLKKLAVLLQNFSLNERLLIVVLKCSTVCEMSGAFSFDSVFGPITFHGMHEYPTGGLTAHMSHGFGS